MCNGTGTLQTNVIILPQNTYIYIFENPTYIYMTVMLIVSPSQMRSSLCRLICLCLSIRAIHQAVYTQGHRKNRSKWWQGPFNDVHVFSPAYKNPAKNEKMKKIEILNASLC